MENRGVEDVVGIRVITLDFGNKLGIGATFKDGKRIAFCLSLTEEQKEVINNVEWIT